MNWLNRIISLFKEPDKLFYPGQEVTMVTDGTWSEVGTGVKFPGPKFGDIVKVKRYEKIVKSKWYISLIGFSSLFQENAFAPVISDDKLEEMLNDIDELIIKDHGVI